MDFHAAEGYLVTLCMYLDLSVYLNALLGSRDTTKQTDRSLIRAGPSTAWSHLPYTRGYGGYHITTVAVG